MQRRISQMRTTVLIVGGLALTACHTITPAPGSDKVHVTKHPGDVAACKAVGNIMVPKAPDGTVSSKTAKTEFRNQAVGFGGNTALVTYGTESVPVEGVAYLCK